jgi:hypothetical protein
MRCGAPAVSHARRLAGMSLAGCLAIAGPSAPAAAEAPCTPEIENLTRLTADAPVTESALLEALTGCDVARVQSSAEGEPLTLFRVSRDGAALLDVVPGSDGGIYAVVIRDATLARDLGHDLGARFRDWARTRKGVTCAPGAEELSGAALCTEADRRDLLLRFDGDWQGPDGELPPPKVLAGWTLAELIWLPGADQR